MAPELLPSTDDDEPEQAVKRDKRTDVYALGMTFLEIITSQVPYAELKSEYNVFNTLEKKQRPTRPNELLADTPKEGTMWRLLMWCWDREPSARPRAEDVLMMLGMMNPR
ncbi:hypothetical protein B0J17DRAFT_178427 [Rhizoctonia solani]|nr:hypothetical protein B0J17DRAFT_178427 [Rhizoctonia solani]